MKEKVFIVLVLFSCCYAAQAPLGKKPSLGAESLTAFQNLVTESAKSQVPEVKEAHKDLLELYQQAKSGSISLGDLSNKLAFLINKFSSAAYNDKKFDSIYGYISLSEYAGLINDIVITDIERATLLAPATKPLPKIRLSPKTFPKKQGLSAFSLETFRNLVSELKDNKNPEIVDIYNQLNDLYQQAKAQTIFLSDLQIKLEALVNKLNLSQYKDKRFQATTYGDISLSEYAQILNDTVLAEISNTVSLFGISQQTINYFKEIINAIESGQAAPPEVNAIKTQLSLLLGRVLEKNISLTDLLDQLRAIATTAEKPQYAQIMFSSKNYGRLSLAQFSDVILRSLIDHIERKVGTIKFIPVAAIPMPPAAGPKQPIKLIPVTKPAAAGAPTAAGRQPTPPPLARTKPVGLNNLGNSCFMNASLQNLIALDDLSNELLKQRLKSNYYEENSFPYEYVNFINAVRSSSGSTYEPRAVCMRGWKRMGFAPLSQQDNDEFINILFGDLLKEDTDPLRKLLEIKLQTFIDGKATVQDPRSKPRSTELLLSVPANKPTLDANLQEFFAVEKGVEYGYPPKPSDKQEKIVSTGQYVIIHLKRNVAKLDPQTKQPMFDNNDQMIMTKITDPISFPIQNLDLNAYAMPGVRLPQYRLKGIVVHTGSARGGHYYGYVRYGNQWYEVNDSVVNQISTQRIEEIARQGYGFDYNNRPDKNQTPTTLFYERM